LNKKPVVSASELKNPNYSAEMINLVADDSRRATRKQEIISEISQVREGKLATVRQIITNAQNILNKDGAMKKELEIAINDLRTLANAAVDSAEKIVWAEKTENDKLLTDLEAKLDKITPPKETPPKPDRDEPMEDVPPPTPSEPLTPQQKEV